MNELEIELFKAKQKLEAADRVMLALDCMTETGRLNARAPINDLRLEYGEPHQYEHLSEEEVKKFREGYNFNPIIK